MASLERAMFVYIANNFSLTDYWVTQDAVYLIWVANGGTVNDARWQLFMQLYKLEPGFYEIIPDEPVAVFFVDPVLWLGMLAWMLANGYDCPSPGFVTAFPEDGFSPCDV